MTRWLLVHPPLLGPAVLTPLAGELRLCGHQVVVPDLRATVDAHAPGWPERWRDAAAAASPVDAVLGFSGAAVTLPSVALAVDASRVVWVDALVPARSGATEADARYVQVTSACDAVAAMARDRGWPVVGDGNGSHLDIATSPERIVPLLG